MQLEIQLSRMKSQRFSTGLSSGDFGGSGRIVDVLWYDEIAGHVPARLIHDDNGMRVFVDMTGDFGQMSGHGVSVAPGHDQSRRLSELQADCAEDIG